MADTKITALAAITTVAPANDLFAIVDVSDNSMAASGTTKNITTNQILGAGGTATLASATITGDLTVDTSTLKVDSTNNVVGITNASPLTGTDGGLTLGVIGSSKAMAISMFNCFARLRERDAVNNFAITTNIDTTNAVLDDNTRTSWKVRFGSGNDNFLIQRAAIGSTTFQDIYSVSATSAVWSDGAGGTRMTLNSTGLGVGGNPTSKLSIFAGVDGDVGLFRGGSTRQLQIGTSATAGYLNTDNTSAGFELRTNGTARAYFDNSGNVGIGVTPKAWSQGKAIEIGSSGNSIWGAAPNQTIITANSYYEGGWKYAANGTATNYEQASGSHFWYSAPTNSSGAGATCTFGSTKMTLDASGNLLVGTTSTLAAWATKLVLSTNSGTTKWAVGPYADPNNFIISASGSFGVYLNGTSAVSWTGISDERLKDIIEPISNAVAKVGQLRSVIGKFKADETNTRRSFLLAQDVQAVLPEAVDASNPDRLGVAYTDVIPLLVAAIKELTARVQTLETR